MILKEYEARREANRLSRLQHPTTVNIRQECLNVYNEKVRTEKPLEENTLRAFFGVSPTENDFAEIIINYPADKFRPLQNFIKGEIKNPALPTVELLAWLIDFKPRPLAYAQRILANGGQYEDTLDSKGQQVKTECSDEVIIVPEDLLGDVRKIGISYEESNKQSTNPKINFVTVIGVTIAILCGMVSVFSQYTRSEKDVYETTNSGCMQWVDDHFERVSCDEQRNGTPVLPMNEKKVKNFRMITRQDTMTKWSIGKAYYIKDKGTIKYYTEAGNYPEDLNRPLKVLSSYMFDKYLRKKETEGNDSLTEQNMKLTGNK
ncbi:MAG TPA: hypothetical protein VK489_08250 [Ferruginibacter sp.]|nr:hypothetical protein [Ferruginibacter sp.]